MIPNKRGQIVKFHTPLEDENPDSQYVVLEIIEDGTNSRVDIQMLGTKLSFVPINTVKLSDLEVVKVCTSDLINYPVKIVDENGSVFEGRVKSVMDQFVDLSLEEISNGYASNVWLTITESNGTIRAGKLLMTF